MPESTRRKLTQTQVPDSRGMRILKFGKLAGGMAGGALSEGFKRMLAGDSLNPSSLLLTPANAKRLSEQLAELRGAAMKLGQMLSMEAGELLPEEFSELLSRLREDAHHMPLGQVAKVLENNWGESWDRKFKQFNFTPMAAASIGQVHEARTKQGDHLAIKIQYPGIRKSIDSDIDNVATLLKMFRIIPEELDIDTLLTETKRQLQQEADYLQEANNQKLFSKQVASMKGVCVPVAVDELTTSEVLAMEFIPGKSLDQLTDLTQQTRNSIARRLIRLALKETFSWGMVQTDPNFANYRYDSENDQLGLLDFGALQCCDEQRLQALKNLLNAAIGDDSKKMVEAAYEVGYLRENASSEYATTVCELLRSVAEPLRHTGVYNFATSDLMTRMSDRALALRNNKEYWHIPPHDVLMLHRKFTGLYLACVRLNAKVDASTLFID